MKKSSGLCNFDSCTSEQRITGFCKKHYQITQTNLKREYYIAYMGGCCSWCGSKNKLEFDHIERNTRSFRIGSRLLLKEDKVLAELRKCQLLCKKCHTKKTLHEQGFKFSTHGTPSMYSNHACRCYDCTEAWRFYMYKKRLKQREA